MGPQGSQVFGWTPMGKLDLLWPHFVRSSALGRKSILDVECSLSAKALGPRNPLFWTGPLGKLYHLPTVTEFCVVLRFDSEKISEDGQLRFHQGCTPQASNILVGTPGNTHIDLWQPNFVVTHRRERILGGQLQLILK